MTRLGYRDLVKRARREWLVRREMEWKASAEDSTRTEWDEVVARPELRNLQFDYNSM